MLVSLPSIKSITHKTAILNLPVPFKLLLRNVVFNNTTIQITIDFYAVNEPEERQVDFIYIYQLNERVNNQRSGTLDRKTQNSL